MSWNNAFRLSGGGVRRGLASLGERRYRIRVGLQWRDRTGIAPVSAYEQRRFQSAFMLIEGSIITG